MRRSRVGVLGDMVVCLAHEQCMRGEYLSLDGEGVPVIAELGEARACKCKY
jgi:hypothetical protein